MTAGQPVDPFPPLEEALQLLIEGLDRLDTAPINPDENPDNEDPFFDERARIMADVAAVAGFMEAVKGLKGKERRLVTLLNHLVDVHEGKKSKLLSPDRKRGRKKPALGEWHHRDRAAAAMEFYTRAGYSNDEAARKVFRRLSAEGFDYMFTDKTPPHEQVIEWRESAMHKKDVDKIPHYWYLINQIGGTDLGPEQAAKYLLRSLS